MHRTWYIKGFARNANDRVVDISYEVISTSQRYATEHALIRARQQGYSDIYFSSVQGAS